MMNRETSIYSSDTLVVVDRSRQRRRWIIIAAVAAALLVIVAAVVLGRGSGKTDTSAASGAGQIPTVTVIVPGRTEVARVLTASGPLAAKRDQPVGIAGSGGKVVRVLVDAGSLGPRRPDAGDRRPLGPGAGSGAARRPGRRGARQCRAGPVQLRARFVAPGPRLRVQGGNRFEEGDPRRR